MRQAAQPHGVVGGLADAIALAGDQRCGDGTGFSRHMTKDAIGECLAHRSDGKQRSDCQISRFRQRGCFRSAKKEAAAADAPVVIMEGKVVIA